MEQFGSNPQFFTRRMGFESLRAHRYFGKFLKEREELAILDRERTSGISEVIRSRGEGAAGTNVEYCDGLDKMRPKLCLRVREEVVHPKRLQSRPLGEPSQPDHIEIDSGIAY